MSDDLLAVITAMEQEAKAVFPDGEKGELKGLPVLKGTLKNNQPYICLIAGVGPMKAAAGTLELCRLSPAIILSIGVSGGLAPSLKAGEAVVGTSIYSGIPGIESWNESDADAEARKKYLPQLNSYNFGRLMGVAGPVMDAAEKSRMHAESCALAVDMESLAASNIAKGHNTPFTVVRAVSDCSECSLPEVVMKSLDEDGNTRVWPIIKAMLKKPSLLFSLIRLGRDYSKALKKLGEVFK